MGLDEFSDGPTEKLSFPETREEYEKGPPEDMSIREWIDNLASRSPLTKDEILIGGTDDPMWCGTDLDHKKAQWFKGLWKEAISHRKEDSIHVRGVHYYVVMKDEPVEPPSENTEWDEYQNTTNCYSYLGKASNFARILGYVPFGGIDDRKNETKTLIEYGSHKKSYGKRISPRIEGTRIPSFSAPGDEAEVRFQDVEAFKEHAVEAYSDFLSRRIKFDMASQQPYHVELWSEKALPDEIVSVATDAGVNVVVTGEGQLSLDVAGEFVKRVNKAEKDAVVFYLCDYDAAGDWMAPAMARKIEWLRQQGQLEHEVLVDVLAITQSQIDEYDLPPKPGGDSNLAKSRKQRLDDDGIVELNALEGRMEVFKEIVRRNVSKLQDESLEEKNEAARQEAVSKMETQVEEAISETDGIEEALHELQEWIEEHNSLIQEASETLEEIQAHEDDEKLEQWEETINEVKSTIDSPEVEVPDGDAELPTDALFDTRRHFDENVQTIRGFRRD